MAKRGCCLCGNETDAQNAPILTLGSAGWPRVLCDSCDAKIITASTAHDYDEIESACRALGDGMVAANVEDSAVIETVNLFIKIAMERAEQIKAGTYDFSKDEDPGEEDSEGGESEDEGNTDAPEFDIPEELRETEEDRALDEKDARANKILDTVTSWAAAVILLAAVVFFIVRFVF